MFLRSAVLQDMQNDVLGGDQSSYYYYFLLQRLTTILPQDMQSDALGAIKALASNARVRDTLLSGTQFFFF
jgi:hypothetical protein